VAPGEERVKALFVQVLKRQPQAQEIEAALAMVRSFEQQPEKSWSALSQVLLLTNELAFLD
jgi:hypothetical protein